MLLDDLLFRMPRLRRAISALIPDRTVNVSFLHRSLALSSRLEIGLLRLSWLLNSSPTGNELASLFSLAGLVRPGCTFVDVGANVGLYSVPMASLGEVLCFSVIAVEPSRRTASLLRRNLAPYPNATLIEGAASDRSGELIMANTGSASVTFRVVESREIRGASQNGAGAHRTACFRLDERPEIRDRADLVVKIDVEGHEAQVLEGMEGLLVERRVSSIMIDGFRDSRIPERLLSRDFELLDGRSLRPYHDHFNLLALSRNRTQRGGYG